MGFNLWDCLALRATEGESGLIPRQEYEAIGVRCRSGSATRSWIG